MGKNGQFPRQNLTNLSIAFKQKSSYSPDVLDPGSDFTTERGIMRIFRDLKLGAEERSRARQARLVDA